MTGQDHASAHWSVRFSPATVRALDRLPRRTAAAVTEFCTGTLPRDPARLTTSLGYDLAGWQMARRGDYRILVQLISDDRVLLIGRIEHRDLHRRTEHDSDDKS